MGAKAIRYAYDMSGIGYEVIKAFPIATGTVVEKGEVVLFSEGKIIVAPDQDQDDPYVGCAAEGHDGSTAGRDVGTEILVNCSPTAVFKCTPNITTTADSGNTTTWVDAEAKLTADNDFNGGWLKLKTTSALTVGIDKPIAITDFTQATGTFTGVFTGGVTAGDTAIMLPPINSFGWDLNSDGTNLDIKANGGQSIKIVDVDLDTEEVFFMFRLHQFANYILTIA